ncbi:MAG: hypothetical protein ACR2QB_08235 [Gammaproteobacteria bacterium]
MNAATLCRVAGFCLALGLSLPAQAMEPPAASYRAELDRCLVALRSDLQEAGTTRLRHTVRGIEKQGIWFEFRIESEVFRDNQPTATRAVTSRCRASRRADVAQIS